MCLWNRYEKEFDKVNDVFELQVRFITSGLNPTDVTPHNLG
jgi:hypothetical protein